MEANPNSVFVDPDYSDSDASQEKLWALAEMARTTGDPTLLARWKRDAKPGYLRPSSWKEPQFFGYLTLSADKDVRRQMARVCDSMVAASSTNAYGIILNPLEYTWGSNETLLNRTAMLMCCSTITRDSKYRSCAERQMDWLLGTNGLGLSFVTGFGSRSVSHPWHWTSIALGKLMPGWASGGPNRWESGDPRASVIIRRGTPPAKCFVDANGATGSWSTNEGETAENAALLFTAGLLSGSH
jgi:endoglucanase